jgi:hypothetical protein
MKALCLMFPKTYLFVLNTPPGFGVMGLSSWVLFRNISKVHEHVARLESYAQHLYARR